MGLKIKNLRLIPYEQKNELKVIFGDEMHLTFEIPHVVGESYLCALDNERILYPINRPVCAYTNVFTRNEGEVSFTLKLTTSKLRDYVSSIKKPMPVWLQIVREVNGKYETVLLDDILAIPSVIDGNMTVYEGDSFKELLDGKMDVPEAEGTAGQVLTLDADGHYSWQDLPEIPEQEQADWDESDSSNVSFIKNKPVLATVATSGSYNDLTDKPNLATVATSGSYNDLTDKPSIPTVNDGKITVNQGGVKKGEFTVNQNGDTTIDLNDGAQSDWDESDSSNVSFIKNKPNLATVATSGSYNDLTNKPIITAPVNADWDESDSSNLAYIFNKPNLATVATSGSYNDLSNKPTIPDDPNDYLCFTAKSTDCKLRLTSYGSNSPISVEYSYDKKTWNTYTIGTELTLSNADDTLYWRGDNDHFSAGGIGYNRYYFVQTDSNKSMMVTGNIMSLLDSSCKSHVIPTEWCFYRLFNGCAGCEFDIKLPATSLKAHCYEELFLTCSKLFNVPVLPADTLAAYCYKGMFTSCNRIKEVDLNEVLPNVFTIDMASTSSDKSMQEMFKDCNYLKKVRFLINLTIFSGSYNPFTNWLNGVSSTGVFECFSTLNISTRGASTVPSGWTISRIVAPWANWDESDSTESAYVMNKPDINALIADALTLHNN